MPFILAALHPTLPTVPSAAAAAAAAAVGVACCKQAKLALLYPVFARRLLQVQLPHQSLLLTSGHQALAVGGEAAGPHNVFVLEGRLLQPCQSIPQLGAEVC
jgi:hypothetical protein